MSDGPTPDNEGVTPEHGAGLGPPLDAQRGAAETVGADTSEAVAPMVLIDRKLRGEASEEEVARLARLMKERPEFRTEYLKQATIHSTLLWSHGRTGAPGNAIDPLAIAQLIHEAEQAARLEAKQEVDSAEARRCVVEPPREHKPQAVLRLAWFAGGAIAATLLLSVRVQDPEQGSPAAPAQVAAVVEPTAAPTPAPPVVAHLLGGNGDAWRRKIGGANDANHGVLAAEFGPSIRQGDRYQLHAGFASIETAAGAAIALEAPCDIQFLGPNHVRLFEGKLIAECPTEESKGFTVDTTTRRIVDLGTEFGVWVNVDGALLTEVFEGKVAASEYSPEGGGDRRG